MSKTKIVSLSQPEVKSVSLVDQITKNKNMILNAVVMFILFCLILSFFYFRSNKTKTQSSQYIQSSLDSWQQLGAEEDLEKLTKMASQYPFLQTQLDTRLAQECLNHKQIESVKTLENRIEKRLSPHIPFLFEFNKISILIAQESYQEALQRSYALLSKLDPIRLKTLYAFELLRIASLEEKIGNDVGFKNAKDQFTAFVSQVDEPLEFKLGKLSLVDFISHIDRQKD